jgi:hypothetical protein
LAGPLEVCDTIYDEMEEVPTKPAEEEEEEKKENNPYKENLVLLQVRAHLLPLILDGNVLAKNTFWKKMLC